jgi:predicted membrane protein (TIGR00267 family)
MPLRIAKAEEKLKSLWRKLDDFERMLRISGVLEICRRYFVMNMFDGALAALGVIMGMWISGIADSRAVIRTVLSAGLAMFISGALGAYLTEKAEREKKLRELEEATFQDIKGSIYERSSRLAVLAVSVVDGISPLIACAILIIPFAVSHALVVDFATAALASLFVGTAMLSALGYFLSRIAGKKPLEYIAFMVLAGIASAIVIVLLGAQI